MKNFKVNQICWRFDGSTIQMVKIVRDIPELKTACIVEDMKTGKQFATIEGYLFDSNVSLCDGIRDHIYVLKNQLEYLEKESGRLFVLTENKITIH